MIVEFHCHTIYSRDSLVSPAALVAACARKGIDRVVITDHNAIAGAQTAKSIDPQRVIIGEEIMTTQGELLAAFVVERIPPGLEPHEAVALLRQQGAFISVSHPFDTARKGHWSVENLRRIAPLVDAVEIFNARCLSNAINKQAEEFAAEMGMPGTAGSDAHTTGESLGAVIQMADFDDAASLRRSLGAASYITRLSSPAVHLASRWATWYKHLRGIKIDE